MAWINLPSAELNFISWHEAPVLKTFCTLSGGLGDTVVFYYCGKMSIRLFGRGREMDFLGAWWQIQFLKYVFHCVFILIRPSLNVCLSSNFNCLELKTTTFLQYLNTFTWSMWIAILTLMRLVIHLKFSMVEHTCRFRICR